MDNETKFETFTFSHSSEGDININLTFTVPALGITMSTLTDMFRKFALACGYTETTVEKYLGAWDDDAFFEFYE